MTGLSPRVRDIAENLNVNMPRRAGEEGLVTSRYAAIVAAEPDPHQDVVQRLRLAPDEVTATVKEVRGLYAARGRRQITWEVSDNATPGDLGERLFALGMELDQPESLAVGMVLVRPLRHAAGEVVVREVTTLEDYRVSSAILNQGFGGLPEDPQAVLRSYERERAVAGFQRYMAFIRGEPVAAANAIYLADAVVMCGGATAPSARGKGAYRALIAARWEEGRRRGAPVLVTQAGSMSRPILRRLGFEELVEIQIYLDTFG